MDDFRIILIVVGLLSIVGLLAHGLWSIRRQQPRKMKARPMSSIDADRSVDAQGFDSDGVGRVRTISSHEPTTEPQEREPTLSMEPVISSASERQEPDLFADQDLQQPEPEPEAPKIVRKPAIKSEPQGEQIELGLAGETQAQEAQEAVVEVGEMAPLLSAEELKQPEPEPEPAAVIQPPEDVLVMHVVAAEGQLLQGAELLHNFLTLGMKFGEMNIFHRHQDSAGRGPVMYSLANMVNPGTFEPDTMEQFETEGVSLFMTLPNQCDETVGFSMMLGAAQALADMHKGQVLNDSHQPWDELSKDRYMGRIQKFDCQPA
ncbi:cell division protein ZipA [Ferrimonas sediminum]|uniref:Cell division protein ZipA n=1 Tax=Ferrimonas sediminum TaxID=718193 RepID=A0A1G8U015_9GAMM|nr:cell division protein ZipA [Ferrimonas sediminum]SDJ47093.1 cell division protein ZipA [Ferrimonas sediminum]